MRMTVEKAIAGSVNRFLRLDSISNGLRGPFTSGVICVG
jgi:hypothetical protein